MDAPRVEDIPRNFFKYRPLETNDDQLAWVLETIETGKIYWPSPDQFNDPFDCVPNYILPTGRELRNVVRRLHQKNEPHANRKERRKFTRSSLKIHPRQFAQEFREQMNAHLTGTALYSLALVPDNILMWSHYANSHQGVCLRFDGRKMMEKFVTGYPVTYVPERPTIRIGLDEPLDVLEKLILNKSDIWDYEEEWRLVNYNGKAGLRQLAPMTLNAVILGCRIQKASERRIVEAVDRQRPPLALFRAVCDAEQFKVHLEPLNDHARTELTKST